MAQIHLKDARQFLQEMDPSTVDLIVSSPPYFLGKEYDVSRKVADFRMAQEEIAQELFRVLKPGGSVCWQIGNHVSKGRLVPLDAIVYNAFTKEDGFILRNRIIWAFGHGEHCRHRFSGRHETVLWFTKGDNYYFNLDPVRVPQKYPGKKHYKGSRRGQISSNPLGKNPGDVWDIPNVKSRHVEKTAHPCQFPVALVQRLIRSMCPPNGLVVDPYVGSGSAGVAALLENRRFSGCDINARYVGLARGRLASLEAGTLKVRAIDVPVLIPSLTQAVARRPSHWDALNG